MLAMTTAKPKSKKIRVIHKDNGRWKHSYFGHIPSTKFKNREWITYGEHCAMRPISISERKKIEEQIKKLPIQF